MYHSDSDYRGNIGIILFNHTSTDYQVKKMDKIAQIIFQHYCHDTILLKCSKLDWTSRGNKGYGSTDTIKQTKKKTKKKTKVYKCMLCKDKFKLLDDLNDHYQTHFNGY